MFLKKKINYKETFFLIIIVIYAYLINWISGNIGLIPIDSFGFLDTGNSILNNKLPIRDFWIFTGLVVDYMEAIFLFLFGNNWNSHLAHASFMNIIATLTFYFFLRKLKFEKKYLIIYCISFATLCYPVSGTPFAYLHAYIFSIISMFVLILAIKEKNKLLWFIFPLICLFAFLSMQTPTTYILIILFLVLMNYFYKSKDLINLKLFLLGCGISLFILFLFFFLTKTPLINFLYQYILFPLTIGEGRLSSDSLAYIGLIDQINFKRLFGEFKFIHFFLFPLLILSFINIKKNKGFNNTVNFTIILCVLAFFFNQLITANQIYIFSLIPILASILHLNLKNLNYDSKLIFLIIFIVIFSTVKFHYRFNIDRKFHDLENIDKSKAVKASLIHQNFKDLKWINKFEDPNKEVIVIKKAIELLKQDEREKILITHYQFISTILDENYNILNRWYLWDNNTHPTENHKYFKFYKSMVNKNVKSSNAQVIYLLGQENEILFDNVKNYFTDLCFESKTLIDKRFSSHEIIKCKN